ncbi:hypothetical protein [Psychroserpens burtonensis]|uniref:hypothetical protein n=1 Tax=Psychroserpens burtonensis TaxID=49278 RepID=UPI0004037E17|nr:hypothetical protein [Psychroserpens burtonensis]
MILKDSVVTVVNLEYNNGEAHINIPVDPYTVVIAHTHPPSEDGYYAMFSEPDITKMGEIVNHVENSFSQSVPTIDITHIVIADGKTFAIRFDDAASVQKLLDIYSDKDKKKEFVNNNGGTASVVEPTKNRADWDEFQQVLNGEKPISDLGCNE